MKAKADRSCQAQLAGRLIASDVRYFGLGSRVEPVAGVRLAWMPGLADIPAGCVVLGADGWAERADLATAIPEIEDRVGRIDGSRVRLYLEKDASGLAGVLRQRGYRSREEIGLLLPRGSAPGAVRVLLEEIVDADGWDRKRALHDESPDSPDGHDTAAARWVELEERKVATGGLRPWLIRVGDTVAGTACTMEEGELMRLKNILVHRALRRRGIATAAVAAFGEMAERSDRTLGLFGVPDTPGARVYRRCGMIPVVRWVEWLGRPLRGVPVPGGAQ